MTRILITMLFAVALDRYLPDRGGFRLFSWYTDWAESIEQRFNGGNRVHGVGAALLAVVPIVLGVVIVHYILGEVGRVLGFIFDAVVLYFCLDLYHLGKTASSISEVLDEGDLLMANEYVQELSGKSAADLSESGIARATVECVLKQGNTLVIAPLFWFALLGPLGVVLQRLASILDKLWGHHSAQFAEFGWAAARLNDLLGWIPARLTALSYAIMGSFEDALHCWRRQAGMWSDINSGPLLASGFGAMHMGNCQDIEGEGPMEPNLLNVVVTADAADIRRAIALLWRVLLFWLAVVILMAGAHLFGIFFP